MTAHRYWRAFGIASEDRGATIELSEFQLLAGTTRVDGGATLTSSIVPASGSLSALSDGSTASVVVLTTGSVLQWDFGGSAQDVTDIRLGSGASQVKFPLVVCLQWSDDAVTWTDRWDTVFSGIVWPGARTLTSSVAKNVWPAASFLAVAYGDLTATSTLYASAGAVFNSGDPGALGYLLLQASSSDAKLRFAGMPSLADVDIRTVIRNRNTQASVVFRTTYWGTDNVTYGYAVMVDGSNIYFGHGSNSATPAGSWSVSAPCTLAYGVDITLRVRMVGAQYDVWVNDVRMLTGTDSTYSAGGEVGLRAYGGIAYFYSLRVNTPGVSTPIIAQQLYAKAAAKPMAPTGYAVPAFSGTRMSSYGRALRDFTLLRDIGSIVGTVKKKGDPSNIPLHRKVRLYRERDGALIQETWSDATTGAYTFVRVDTLDTYTVMAYDYEHNYRAVVADNLSTT